MRITQKIMMNRAIANISLVHEQVAKFQQQLTTGKRLGKPSDDPAGVTRSLAIRTDLKLTTQFMRNIDSGIARLSATEAALDAATQLMQRARELTLLAANDTLDQTQRVQIATEVGELLEEAISIGNQKFAGQFIFAGHQSTTGAFSAVGAPPTAVTYNGDAGAVQRDISVGVRVNVNVPGDTVFAGLYTALIGLRDNLLSGNVNAVRTTDLNAIDGALDQVLTTRGLLGATENRLRLTRDRLEQQNITQLQQRAEIEDTDVVDTVVRLRAQESVLEAALATTARSIQVTLLDFLR